MVVTQSIHVRLPQRSAAVEGEEQIPGQPSNVTPIIDPRTVSQDPTVKPKGLTP